MADSNLALGQPVTVTIPGVNVLLYPLTLEMLGCVRENLVKKRKECVPKASEFLTALDNSDINDPEVLKVAISEIMGKACELNNDAANVGFEIITACLDDVMNLYDIFLMCMRNPDGTRVLPISASTVCMYLGRRGMDFAKSDPSCDIQRWMILSGLLDEPNPKPSETVI